MTIQFRPSSLHDRFSLLKLESGATNSQVSQAASIPEWILAGIDQASLSAAEDQVLLRLCRFFGVSMEFLLGYDEEADGRRRIGPDVRGKENEKQGGETPKSLRISSGSPLTKREMDVLKELMNGLSDESIAKTLGIKVSTVRCHVKHLLEKTDQPSRTALAVQALKSVMQK